MSKKVALTREEMKEIGMTEEQIKIALQKQTRDRRVYSFLSYKGERGYIKSKIQYFKNNNFFFKINIKDILPIEKTQLLNNGYKHRTNKKEGYYIFFLDEKVQTIDGASKAYFSLLNEQTIKEKEENK